MESKNKHITDMDEQIKQLSSKVLDLKKLIQSHKDLTNTHLTKEDRKSIKQLIEYEKYYCLFLSAQIDIIICVKHLVSDLCFWEKSFFMNIAYLKIHEIKKKIQLLINDMDTDCSLNKECKEKIRVKLDCFNTEHSKYIQDRRNGAGGHYDKEFTKYIENNPNKQQKIILDFIDLLGFVQEIIRPNSINPPANNLQSPHDPS